MLRRPCWLAVVTGVVRVAGLMGEARAAPAQVRMHGHVRAGEAIAAPAHVRMHGHARASGPPPASRGDLVRELERLADGLTLMSEADFPLHVVTWRRPGGTPTAPRIAALTGQPHPELAETMTVDAFFRTATTSQAGTDAEDQAVARRFGGLVQFLETRLSDVRVFRFGRLTVRAYIVGTTVGGDWIGLATTQVET